MLPNHYVAYTPGAWGAGKTLNAAINKMREGLSPSIHGRKRCKSAQPTKVWASTGIMEVRTSPESIEVKGPVNRTVVVEYDDEQPTKTLESAIAKKMKALPSSANTSAFAAV